MKKTVILANVFDQSSDWRGSILQLFIKKHNTWIPTSVGMTSVFSLKQKQGMNPLFPISI